MDRVENDCSEWLLNSFGPSQLHMLESLTRFVKAEISENQNVTFDAGKKIYGQGWNDALESLEKTIKAFALVIR